MGGIPKWMVYKGNPIKKDDLGVPPFMEPPNYSLDILDDTLYILLG